MHTGYTNWNLNKYYFTELSQNCGVPKYKKLNGSPNDGFCSTQHADEMAKYKHNLPPWRPMKFKYVPEPQLTKI
jgi:hypothetical protein